ncbi:trafficking protein Mon1-domain-containing protein [Chaetomium sp. MPI-SDFR-AT-0129]|nr:trafficking protein Mon1-domain-containing protein [Chaetomium sp. MPI-SDFR-AT-0129]
MAHDAEVEGSTQSQSNEAGSKEMTSPPPSKPPPPISASPSASPTPSPALSPPALPPRRKISSEGFSHAAQPTTAVSSIDISTLSFPDGSRGTFPSNAPGPVSVSVSGPSSTPNPNSGYGTPTQHSTPGDANNSDAMSIMSLAPTMRAGGHGGGDLASLVAGGLNRKSRAWNMLRSQSSDAVQPFESIELGIPGNLAGFAREFDDIPDDNTDEVRMALWKSKMKHYMILSSAGKPIYSRHGDLSLINSYMGVVQTIISFYEEGQNPLLGFTAGDARFVIAIEGPLYFVAVSKLGESDAQLRSQLDALYMQILSTLTLPTLKSIFVHRPSTDLRKPLEGTESLLSSLADSFTKGSPSTLLGALECLRLRKSQRHAINNVFLKCRSEKLLYGLIVAGGKLVSVIRPRKHSLHPSDLQLIFNMLFESGGIQAGGGESWIPLCLPAFNNRGYLYMYVSFFDSEGDGSQNPAPETSTPQPPSQPPSTETTSEAKPETTPAAQPPEPVPPPNDEAIALILISPDKESFYDLQEMRTKLATQLTTPKTNHLALIRTAARAGRPRIPSIAPGSQIAHFLYKSRANVQFCMSPLPSPSPPSPEPVSVSDKEAAETTLTTRRRLMSIYHELHASVHTRHAHLRVLHAVASDAASLAWITPVFELYCVAGPHVSRTVMAQGANAVVQWARREEERLFIIGGGVF